MPALGGVDGCVASRLRRRGSSALEGVSIASVLIPGGDDTGRCDAETARARRIVPRSFTRVSGSRKTHSCLAHFRIVRWTLTSDMALHLRIFMSVHPYKMFLRYCIFDES